MELKIDGFNDKNERDFLSVNNLTICSDNRTIVNRVNFKVDKNKIVCLVGESGSGKSVTASSMIGILSNGLKRVEGEVIFKGKRIFECTAKEVKEIRGKKIFSIFQDALNVFNPCITLEKQLYDLISSHMKGKKEDIISGICNIMKELNFDNPSEVLKKYSFQLSGGMLQRIMIACAIYMKADLIIADEPTSALDVTAQKRVLKEFSDLNKKYSTAILLITHDFGVVAEIGDEVLVMQNGTIVEHGDVFSIFESPQHSYTKKLLNSALLGKDEG